MGRAAAHKAGGAEGTESAVTTSAATTAATPRKRQRAAPPPAPPGAELLAKADRIRRQLAALYPSPGIPLEHTNHFQLLVAVMLSAQTTDKKVNEVTPTLFKLAPDAAAMAAQEVSVIQAIIQPIGLAPTKAKNLRAAAALLVERHGGQVPSTFEELEALPGVGHKTASVVMAQAFGLPAFPVDTHIHRLAQRWGLTADGAGGAGGVEATERDLKALFLPEEWHDLHLQIIYFGREHCPAQRHDPTGCPICSWAAVPPYDR
ncbi:endonuclease III [Monoraphidium neglectum]|uniref:Endonuclease III n=1 Tax=Monoraphidium neglectum TaxID=145388 RepID=A0A0D2L5K0_9CHLO|nr:endonuclease III [Monoraphidium neglectum]KIZ02304.1 endonuclease III [Monoraphidium neglectum]|eukprot:XP_013901323.1 endonuclease III [Monoraphidium neglectum]